MCRSWLHPFSLQRDEGGLSASHPYSNIIKIYCGKKKCIAALFVIILFCVGSSIKAADILAWIEKFYERFTFSVLIHNVLCWNDGICNIFEVKIRAINVTQGISLRNIYKPAYKPSETVYVNVQHVKTVDVWMEYNYKIFELKNLKFHIVNK